LFQDLLQNIGGSIGEQRRWPAQRRDQGDGAPERGLYDRARDNPDPRHSGANDVVRNDSMAVPLGNKLQAHGDRIDLQHNPQFDAAPQCFGLHKRANWVRRPGKNELEFLE
jgi:hypothetical protein